MPNTTEEDSTNEPEQQLPAAVISSEPKHQLAVERKAFLDKRLTMKGYSLKVWATKAGVATSTVSCYRNSKTNPQFSTLCKLARALGISIEEMPR